MSNLSLPRILCLHGGGVCAKVFRLQCRAIIQQTQDRFRFVFADGPFPSPPHEAIAEVYGEYGPFARWLVWKRSDNEVSEQLGPATASHRIVEQCRQAMVDDEGNGPWVGVLGFSQGAKIAASLLWAQEHLSGSARPMPADVDFKFGVLMAGSGPVVVLDPSGKSGAPPLHMNSAANYSTAKPDQWPSSNEHGEHLVTIPTLHVHGLRDPGLDGHRILLTKYCKEGTTRLVEWDGNHRLPIKTNDVELVVNQLLQIAEETGVAE